MPYAIYILNVPMVPTTQDLQKISMVVFTSIRPALILKHIHCSTSREIGLE